MKESPENASPAKTTSDLPEGGSRYQLHPLSGLLLILIDNLFFGANVVSFGWATPIICVLAFGITFMGVFVSQKIFGRDRMAPSLTKGLITGILAGIPTSIMGTAIGGIILVAAGLKPRSQPRPR